MRLNFGLPHLHFGCFGLPFDFFFGIVNLLGTGAQD
jgi:hypothetical protein